MSTLPGSAEYNPYTPPSPQEPSDLPSEGPERAPGEGIKWIYAGAAALSAVLFFVLRFGGALGLGADIIHTLVSIVDGPLRWAILIIALWWVYQAWSGIPREASGGVTPAGAIGRLFVPVYSIAWIFLVNIRLCDAIDGVLRRAGDGRRAPRSVAIAATILHFVPIVLLLTEAKAYAFLVTIANTVLWFVYMLQCDVVRRAVVRAPREEADEDT